MKGKIYSIGYTKTYVILNVGVLFERAGVDSSAWRRTAFDRRDEGIDLIAGSDGFDIDTPIILVPDDSRNAYLVSHHFCHVTEPNALYPATYCHLDFFHDKSPPDFRLSMRFSFLIQFTVLVEKGQSRYLVRE